MKTARKSMTVAIAAAALMSCHSTATTAAAPAVQPATAKPAMWKVYDKDTTIYLLGSMHVLPNTLAWQTPKIESAIRESSGLVLEMVMPKDPQAAAAPLMKLGMTPGLPPLLDRVPAAKRPALKAAIDGAAAKLGIPPAFFDRFESWAAAIVMSSAMLKDLPASSDAGVESVLTKRFETDHKPVSGLETGEQQLGFFDALPPATQNVFLAQMGDDTLKAKEQFNQMVAAWSSGDLNAIAASFDDELKATPELANAIVYRRNANWTVWLKNRMAQPGTIFVAVGAGHLAGPRSVIEMLKAQGLKVTRVE